MPSVWAESAGLPEFERLSGSLRTDVLIIGGGMAGLLCAAFLARAGIDYVLVEADRLCSGVTKNTTAKITAQHGLIYDTLLRRFGRERAGLYLRANQEALRAYRALCREIDCDFEEKDNYVYSLSDRAKLERELAALETLGAPAQLVDRLPLPFRVAGAVRFADQAQFHPLKFAAALSKGLNVYERTRVRELKGRQALTDTGRIIAEKIIVATHFPFLDKHGAYFLKLYQERSYVLALENAPDVGGMYVDEATGGFSFRNYGGLLLLGSGGHRTGKPGGAWRPAEALAARAYPRARHKARWATQDCMTLDSIPYIGPYSAATRGLYVATGFNKWGMSSAMVAARILSELVQGREPPYAPVFSPSRSLLRPQLALNAAESVAGLLRLSQPRCPHLGCALSWNARERSWDCPCHGSRFDERGALLNDPATGGLKRPIK